MLPEQPAGRTLNSNTGLLAIGPGATMNLDVMTKTTLKTLWFAGGGVLATWLAVAPNNSAPSTPAAAPVDRAVAREPSAEELNTQAAKLRERMNAVPMRPSARNPFRFGAHRVEAPAGSPKTSAADGASAAPLGISQPALTLSGIAERNTPQGPRRTAVISGNGELFLVAEGEIVTGGYRVVTVEPDAVVLRDQAGNEVTLVLR